MIYAPHLQMTTHWCKMTKEHGLISPIGEVKQARSWGDAYTGAYHKARLYLDKQLKLTTL
jgi:hypothetical protein